MRGHAGWNLCHTPMGALLKAQNIPELLILYREPPKTKKGMLKQPYTTESDESRKMHCVMFWSVPLDSFQRGAEVEITSTDKFCAGLEQVGCSQLLQHGIKI